MSIEIDRFTLDGCQCRLKFDPRELQELLYETLHTKAKKKAAKLDIFEDTLHIAGSFIEIDEGNFALHLMLAFLGKARVVCRARVCSGDDVLLDQDVRASATCACWTSPKSQLRYDSKLIADIIVKEAIRALKKLSEAMRRSGREGGGARWPTVFTGECPEEVSDELRSLRTR